VIFRVHNKARRVPASDSFLLHTFCMTFCVHIIVSRTWFVHISTTRGVSSQTYTAMEVCRKMFHPLIHCTRFKLLQIF